MGSDRFDFEEVRRFMGRLVSALLIAVVLFMIAGQPSIAQSQPVLTQDATALGVEGAGGTVRIVYFYAEDCPHCIAIVNDLLQPLQDQYGDSLEIKMIEISAPDQYRLLLQAEALYGVTPEQRGLPTLILNNEVLIGEDEIRERLAALSVSLTIHLVTADTHGRAAGMAERLPVQLTCIEAGDEVGQKRALVERLSAERVVAIGNGANDAEMLATAALGIAVLGPEGLATVALRAADVVVGRIEDALDLLLRPQRLVATLRR